MQSVKGSKRSILPESNFQTLHLGHEPSITLLTIINPISNDEIKKKI